MTGSPGHIAQVVPDIATFAVDDGFRYRIPDGLAVDVGSRVRIRVSGRRRRGYVTAVMSEPEVDGLVDIDGVVGTVPSFSASDLPLLRWCATHYVAPMATVLKRTVPVNVPRKRAEISSNRGRGHHVVGVHVSPAPHDDRVVAMLGDLPDEASALVIVPTHLEAERIAAQLGVRTVLAHSGLDGRASTKAWTAAATQPGTILVGTREVALWPIASLDRIIVVEDSRRVMKSPSTPTFGVREICAKRAELSGLRLDFITPMPSLEVLERASDVASAPGRAWGLIEIVDRTEEPPTGAPLLERTRSAIAAAVKAGHSVFVLVPRRGYARAVRCARCGHLRVCAQCGAALAAQGPCVRCATPAGPCQACGGDRWQGVGAGIGSVVEDLRRVVGNQVGTTEQGRAVRVGTERDLVAASGVALAVAADLDSVARAPTYRAAEDALRLGVRLSHLVERGAGRRTMVQTSDAGQPVISTLRSGQWEPFMDAEAEARRAASFPPFGELIALEVAPAPDDLDANLRAMSAHATVMGPADMQDRTRWLIRGTDLGEARVRLRPVVRNLRDAGVRVRVDVDPIDL